jgi:hypothetical protein
MKSFVFGVLSLLCAADCACAQDRIYRCGNEYTNNAQDSQARACKLVQGGNITVVPGTRTQGAAGNAAPSAARPAAASLPSAAGAPPVDAAAQRARDGDARQILEMELRKVEARQSELLAEYNRGEPEKRTDEIRNNQKYLDRVADIKTQLARADSDIASLKRELARLPGSGGQVAPTR